MEMYCHEVNLPLMLPKLQPLLAQLFPTPGSDRFGQVMTTRAFEGDSLNQTTILDSQREIEIGGRTCVTVGAVAAKFYEAGSSVRLDRNFSTIALHSEWHRLMSLQTMGYDQVMLVPCL